MYIPNLEIKYSKENDTVSLVFVTGKRGTRVESEFPCAYRDDDPNFNRWLDERKKELNKGE